MVVAIRTIPILITLVIMLMNSLTTIVIIYTINLIKNFLYYFKVRLKKYLY